MSYSGNMPDWHQYNPPQPGRTTTTSHTQNAPSSHHFISSISPPASDGINLSTSQQSTLKHQRNEVNYPRNYPTAAHHAGAGPTSTALSTPGAHHPLSNCPGHYGTPSRPPLLDPPSLHPPLPLPDPEIPHRTPQMAFSTPVTHSNANLTVNPNLHTGGLTSQVSPVAPLSPGRQSYPCKLPCCNPDTQMAYQHWEKYNHYQTNSTYRENLQRTSFPMENRRYVPEINLRKDCAESKEHTGTSFPGSSLEHRRSYDYKYRKEMSRNYSSGIHPTYPMQSYNFPSDCQKCPHSVKDYMRRGGTSSSINQQNQQMMKYPEQQIPQKYNGKLNYQNGNHQPAMPTTSTTNLPSPLQNSYFNTPMSRDVPREFPREYQEANAINRIQPPGNTSIMHGSYQKFHVYQQKIAMQRFSLENHLRGITRVPGYQSHPKYQEWIMRYREILRLQQNIDCQNFLQEPKIPSTSPNAPVPPINLQFDQNGCLINSSFTHGHYPGMHNSVNPAPNPEVPETSPQPPGNVMNPLDQNMYKHPDQSITMPRDESLRHLRNDVPGQYRLPDNPNDNFDSMIVDVDSIDPTRTMTSGTETMSTTTAPTADLANSREFTDKPQLDVRQFLANWDETEEEEGNGNTQEVSSNPSSVIVRNMREVNAQSHSSKVASPQETHLHNQSSNQNINMNTSPIQNVNQNEQQAALNTSPVESTPNTNIETTVMESSEVETIASDELKTIEDLTSSGAIVQCIQSDSSDIPTIHIVDHLPQDSELATIRTVYGDVTSLSIEQIASAPIEIINDNQETGETITLFGQDTGVCSKEPECPSEELEEASGVIDEVGSMELSPSSRSPVNLTTNSAANDGNRSEEMPQDGSPPRDTNENNQKTQISETTPLAPSLTTSLTTSLRKQHSFASEESHNPDDISLPDLPMSECTPISTTLNTPVHSDSEESSGPVENLSISTNPIEVVQNSPIISFTHSPLKTDPYSNLETNRLSDKRPHNSLDFDFVGSSDKDSAVIENFEIARRSSPESSLSGSKNPEEFENRSEVPLMSNPEKSDKDQEFYPSSDPLVGMNKEKKNSNEITDSSNDITQVGECSVGSLNSNPVPGTPVSRILSTDEIDTGKCPSIIDTEDFQPTDDLDKLCNISLDSSCMMPLIAEDSHDPRLSIVSIDGLKNVLPISNLDDLDSSDDEEKDHNDWVEVGSMDGCVETSGANDMIIMPNENPSIEVALRETELLSEDKQEKNTPQKAKYIRSIFDTSEDSQSTGFEEFMRRREERNVKDRLNALAEYRRDKLNILESVNIQKNSNEGEISLSKSHLDNCGVDLSIIAGKSFEEPPTEIHRNQIIRKIEPLNIDACKVIQSFRRTHKDTDVEIHVANINVEKLCNSTSEEADAIEIKINVSRHDRKNRLKCVETAGDAKKSYFAEFENGNYRPQKIFPRRRISNPESTGPKKSSKNIRRRYSGGHSYRFHRKSTEERNLERIRLEPLPKLPPLPKSFNKSETSEVSLSEGPVSSHDDSQTSTGISIPTETPNTCDSQGTEEESIFEDAEMLKSKNPSRRESLDYENFAPDFDELENMATRSSQSRLGDVSLLSSLVTPGPSHASQTTDLWSKMNFSIDPSAMDFDNFDVAPNDNHNDIPIEDRTSSTLTEDRALSRRLEECEKFRNPYSKTPGSESPEVHLNTVPIYTTKDGKIKYSPNPKYTYRVLIMEARQREGLSCDFLRDNSLSDRRMKDYHGKRLQKRKQETPNKDDRRKYWSEYNVMRSKDSLSRKRLEDSSWRTNRSNKYDRWRERPPELESDEVSIGSCKSDFNRALLGKKPDRVNSAEDFNDLPIKKSHLLPDKERGTDSLMVGSINNLSVMSQDSRTEVVSSNVKCVENRIFNGDELELFSRIVLPTPEMVDRTNCEVDKQKDTPLNDFEEIVEDKIDLCKERSGGGVPELSDEETKDPKDAIEFFKPPSTIDVEQDSQAILTDSGLESSTTYTEGCKEPKPLPMWQREIITNAEGNPVIRQCEKSSVIRSQSINLTLEENNDKKEDKIEQLEEIIVDMRDEMKDEVENEAGEIVREEIKEKSQNNEEIVVKIIESPKDGISRSENPQLPKEQKISDITSLEALFPKNHQSNFESSILKGLDLAFPSRRIVKSERQKIVEITKEDSTINEESVSKPVGIFEGHSSSFSSTRKSQVPTRRASSDEMKNFREKIPPFQSKFEFLPLNQLFCDFRRTEMTNKISEEVQDIEMRGEEKESQGKMSREIFEDSQTTEHQFEKPEVPPVNSIKSFVTSTRKTLQVDTPEMSTESEVSMFDESLSSTQFGSEYAASKPDEGSSTGVNFLSTSSQEAIDATDLKEVRKNLALCALIDKSETIEKSPVITPDDKIEAREKILIFSGRITSESEDDSNAQDGSPIRRTLEEDLRINPNEDNVLNFSGKIQSPEAPSDPHISSPCRFDLPIGTDGTSKGLNFSGKIPSPKNSEDFSPKSEHKLELTRGKNDEDKNLTFTGRIQSESPPKSPTTFDKIPKFIIKKTDCSSRSSSISQIFPSDTSAQRSFDSRAVSLHRPSSHPKIPKMIIRNVRSRPGTPTIEENAVELSFPKTNESTHQKVFEVKIKFDEKSTGNDPGPHMRKALGIIECKVPKMKIKLEDKHSKMTFENASMELSGNDSESFTNVPKLKIRKIRKSHLPQDKKNTVLLHDKPNNHSIIPMTATESSISVESSLHPSELPDKLFDKIPKLKIKKQESRKSSPSPDSSRRKRPRSPLESSTKRLKKSSNHHRSAESRDSKFSPVDLETTTNSITGLSEKIPKVIIKRASSTSEFKCELSKDGAEGIISSSRWQPEVKLERFKVLDSIAKEQGTVHLPGHILEEVTRSLKTDEHSRSSRKFKRTSSVPSRRRDESDRSSSRGRRRYSDPEKQQCCQINDSESEDLPRRVRRHFTRPLIDFSSQDESLNTRSEISSIISKLKDSPLNEKMPRLIVHAEDTTRSEFEYPSISSSDKPSKKNSQKLMTPIPTAESVIDATADTKSSEDQSVIKLESSDDSQTTIEMLPAASDTSQPESEIPTPLEGERRIANGDMARLYSSDAIPTQFELELEIVDNSSVSMEVPVPGIQSSPSKGHEEYLWNYQQQGSSPSDAPGPSFLPDIHKMESQNIQSEAKTICSSDLLVKEVLAAKETLKRYLASSKEVSSPAPRMKTAAEKKQFSAFESPRISGKEERVVSGKERSVFQKDVGTSGDVSRVEGSRSRNGERLKKDRSCSSSVRKENSMRKDGQKVSNKETMPKSSRDGTKELKRERSHSGSSESTSKRMRPPSTSGSLRREERRESSSKAEGMRTSDGGSRSHKKFNCVRSHENVNSRETRMREAMPVLVPEGGIVIEPSLRETSRSPPVITKQESSEINVESPKKIEESVSEKIREIIERETEGMTFADIVTKMAYHEKATIKHKRYCILCERWFPTTARHRRHLSGYQHRHTELTQRRTVHALFMLFTGKPCPRLLPASIVRTDCTPGEATPLQIAIQDVAISLEKGAIDKIKKLHEEDK
ncbi:uncharacterized protein [Fopius arisanus]|uniref:Uncharacterized protein n=1 Tax=Fopius arisanus TaxID=64838 RepID=A0A0C9RLU6_9HYME|nr:PREDICTED: uncharacterized protein LOC105270741 [Fopius arisanus]XP_011310170.1 PREDICTED: uncharacterized protein LOC105270741 [Fopius arisanus]